LRNPAAPAGEDVRRLVEGEVGAGEEALCLMLAIANTRELH
jgi:hypothetical protein